jgi:hypothetical protein
VGNKVDNDNAGAQISSSKSDVTNDKSSTPSIETESHESSSTEPQNKPVLNEVPAKPSIEETSQLRIEENPSQDMKSVGQLKESRDASVSEAAADSLREDASEVRTEEHNQDKSPRGNKCNEDIEPKECSFRKDKSLSSCSLDRSASTWSKLSDILSTTSEGIEMKKPVKPTGHRRRKSRVGKMSSFFMDKIQPNQDKQSLVNNE